MKKIVSIFTALFIAAAPLSVVAASPTTTSNGGGYTAPTYSNLADSPYGTTGTLENGDTGMSLGNGTYIDLISGNIFDGAGNLVGTRATNQTDREIYTFGTHGDDSFYHFNYLQVDGQGVWDIYYKVTNGSVNVRLAQAYIDQLSVGTHTLTIFFDDRASVSTQFVVSRRGTTASRGTAVPNTGDQDNTLYYVMFGGALIVIAGAGYILHTSKN